MNRLNLVSRSRCMFAQPLLGLVLLAASSHADDMANRFAMEQMGRFVGSNLSDIAADLKTIGEAHAEFNRNMAEARAEFWRQYPNGPGFAAASQKYHEKLWGKDWAITWQELMSGRGGTGARRQDTPLDFLRDLQGPLDGDIPPIARLHFYSWVNLIRQQVRQGGPQNDIADFPIRALKAMGGAALPAYRTYLVAREYAEFAAAGKLPPSVNGPASYVELLITLDLTQEIYDVGFLPPGRDLFAEARADASETYGQLVRVFGEQAVQAAATRIMNTRLNRDGQLSDLAPLGLVGMNGASGENAPAPSGRILLTANGTCKTVPCHALLALLTGAGPREYLLGMVSNEVSAISSGTLGRRIWQKTEAQMQALESVYGRQTVMDAATEVWNAPKRLKDGSILQTGLSPDRTFYRTLATKAPRDYVRAMLPAQTGSKAELDAAYQKLIARYPEPKVLAAVRGLLNPAELPPALRPVAVGASVRPGAHLGSLNDLVEILRGIDDPAVVNYVEPQKPPNPRYLAWAAFAPGATVTIKTNTVERREPTTLTYGNGLPVKQPGYERPIDVPLHSTYVLSSLAADQAIVKLTEQTQGAGYAPKTHDVYHPSAMDTSPAGWGFPFGPTSGRQTKKVESGSETLMLAGKQIQTRWWAVTFANPAGDGDMTSKVWFSDRVPGGIVKTSTPILRRGPVIQAQEAEVISFQGEPAASGKLFEWLTASFAGRAVPSTARNESTPVTRPGAVTNEAPVAPPRIPETTSLPAGAKPAATNTQIRQTPAGNPSPPQVPQVAQRTEPVEQQRTQPLPERSVAAEVSPQSAVSRSSSALPEPTGITGCWVYNSIPLRLEADGRVTGFVQPGRWRGDGGNRYAITWAVLADTVQVSPDGRSLSGTNNFGPAVSATRTSGPAGSPSLVGSWLWSNGATVVISQGGVAKAGTLSGRWASQGGTSYRVEWDFTLADQVTLSTDGRSFSGQNNLGVPSTGTRASCPN